MPDLIMLRLKPSKPMAPGEFTALLTGLTISAFDLTFADSVGGVLLGNATGVANPHLTSTTNNNVTIGNTSILQHYIDVTDVTDLTTHRHLESVATAVIQANPPAAHHEYPTPTAYDVRLQIENAGGSKITDDRVEFNVAVTTVAAVPTSQKSYFQMAASLYVTLPATGASLDPSVAYVDLPANGQPPPFADLAHAIDLVLADDPGSPHDTLVGAAPLTPAQSMYVASEIVWNRQANPAPEPDATLGQDPFGALYTIPPVDPMVSSDDVSKSRPKFEADEDSYYGTLEADVLRMAGFVFSAAAAIAEERLSIASERARIDVPLISGAATAITIPSAGIAVTSADGLQPAFVVPASVFYALAATMPTQIDADRRFAMAELSLERQLLSDLSASVDAGVLTFPVAPSTEPGPSLTIDQVARRLHALGGTQTEAAAVPLIPPIDALVGDWLSYAGITDDIDTTFWAPEVGARPDAYLQLVLEAVTGEFQPLIDAIRGLPYHVASVGELIALTDQQWRDLFLPPQPAPPQIGLLPPWTLPGTPTERVAAFIRTLRTFFAVPNVVPSAPTPVLGAPPHFPIARNDVFAAFVADYPSNAGGTAFLFADPANPTAIAATSADVLPGGAAAQKWLADAVLAIGELWRVTDVGAGDLHFSLVEALYARGFTSAAQIAALSPADFQFALIGGVGYPWATHIYARAGGGPVTGPVSAGFNPMSPDGSLVDCVPPPQLSPLGPVEYLHQMLAVSAASTCDDPFHPGDPGALASLLAARRGPITSLHATAANLQTPLPLIDLVNESLETLATNVVSGGAIYDTASTEVAGRLVATDGTPGGTPWRHDPQTLFAAVPEHSSPASPVAQPGAYELLRGDFSAPTLPYSQPLDVNRSYLEALRTSRFATMRLFRRDITEFAIDAAAEPADFLRHQWRYPVRLDVALEYLHISPEEHAQLYTTTLLDTASKGNLLLRTVYGFSTGQGEGRSWTGIVARVPEFLRRTGLTYCGLLDLAHCGFLPLRPAAPVGRDQDPTVADFPACEPCCLDDLVIDFGGTPTPQGTLDDTAVLARLVVFIRLWRTLQTVPYAALTMSELADVSVVLGLFDGSGNLNPDFIRQLAAFVMLRELLCLPLHQPGPAPAGATGADRTQLLSLWAGPGAAAWPWAVRTLVEHVQSTAERSERRLRHQPELTKVLIDNLDPLSVLAGFDPATPTDTWHAKPTGTLRLADVLLKVYRSEFSVGEVLYLSSNVHLDGDDPFALPTGIESADNSLELPDDDAFGLWALRAKLLAVDADCDSGEWTWARIVATLADEFGYAPTATGDPLTMLGEHFFPSVLEREGWMVEPANRRFSTPLAVADTTPAMWNTPPHGPFRYDPSSATLSVRLPLRDGAVDEKLSSIRALGPAERTAVQALYFAPRTLLATFGLVFGDFAADSDQLIGIDDDDERFASFAAAFARFHRRCRIIAEHLAEHVTGGSERLGRITPAETWRLLRTLHGDENAGTTPWEDDSGAPPTLTWPGRLTGGAFAALLGLVGTGLTGQFSTGVADPAWRDLTGPLSLFGRDRDQWNAPVTTVVPAMTLTLTEAQLEFAAARNGFALRDVNGEPLYGAQPFTVQWTGMILIEQPGRYEFAAGEPTPEGEEPGRECCPQHRWQVTLRRGQRSWQLLNRDGPGEPAPDYHSRGLELRRGCYELSVTFVHDEPDFDSDAEVRARHTGFQLKYTGPDTGDDLVTVPHRRLYRAEVDSPLGAGLQVDPGPAAYLRARYTSSLRDVRRTYQRAYKSALLVDRFGLTARPLATDPESELGYLLEHEQTFAGRSYYRTGPSGFGTHQAWFALDLLPVDDPYRSPAGDERTDPSPRRQAALFDTWERFYDYTRLRRETRQSLERPAWRLFYEAAERQPDDPAQLVRHLGIDVAHAPQVLTYFVLPVDYTVAAPDLESEAWAIRAWRAEQWLDALTRCFRPDPATGARPHRWAADDPALAPDAGNDNLTAFLIDGALETGTPRRYDDVRVLDDGLRVRARDALVAWLCALDRVALPFAPGAFATGAGDLSDLLLQDVSCGTVQRASRIEDAISAVQAFVQRARLGLEPSFVVPPAFVEVWDGRFATFHEWQCCVERTLYRENWIDWDELRRARRVEAFRFLEDRLRSQRLSVAVPGGMEWWPGNRPPVHPSLTVIQDAEWSQIAMLTPGPLPEGLDLRGTPDADARPAWLAPVGVATVTNRDGGGTPQNDGGGDIEVRGDVDPTDSAELARLPLWLQAAVRAGRRYLRVAAAGLPPASAGFRPCDDADCCCTCGGRHEALVDEYYFWLEDGEKFAGIVQDADVGTTDTDATSDWHQPDKLPSLLHCDTVPVVYLTWSRVRHGEFEPPRRSADATVIDPTTLPADTRPQLDLTGRSADSLSFSVTGAVTPTGYDPTTPPGFRYDLATDSALSLPLMVAAPATAPGSFPGGLDAYPYFAYVCAGAPVEPPSLFAVAETVAGALRANCRFEAALKWYELILAPLAADNSWTECGRLRTGGDVTADATRQGRTGRDVPCCPTIAPDDDTARVRAVLLLYVETLLDWADALLCRNTPETFRRADVIVDIAARILGAPLATVPATADDRTAPPLADFVPSPARLNPRLTALYERADDRAALVHTGQNARRLVSGRPVRDQPYFGDEPAAGGCGCDDGCDDGCLCGGEPYRFQVLADRAATLAGDARALGSELLSAYEKGDAEYLASLRATHERQVLELTIEVRQNQLRDADWQVQALAKSKENAQSRLRYYQNLIAVGLISGETGYETLTGVSMGFRTAGNISEAIAQGIGAAPDFWFGGAGIAGSPLAFIQVPMGTKLAGGFTTAARILNALSEIASSGAGLSATEAGWDRREAEWRQQVDAITIEIEQIERQVLGAERRRDQARRELDNSQRQVENAAAIQNFLRDRFTSHELYLYLQRETAAMYHASYALARDAARQAQRAFNYELGHLNRSFLPDDGWDSLHEGLLAGDRLVLAMRRMEKAYRDTNCREYELTKHVSLRLSFPLQFLQLQATGATEIEIPEWMFDVDYPGQYMRRIRSVSLSIPCVVGPYTGVHSRLTLLSSSTRINPAVVPTPVACCDDRCAPDECGCGCSGGGGGGYEPQPDDRRIVRSYAATQAIATSTGQNDSGLFELSFHDERYLPFEFAGAVSRWRLELPPETNFFDLDTLSDVVVHLNYTAREGGEVLAAAAAESARCRLPGDGMRLLDLRRDLPDAWSALHRDRDRRRPWARAFDLVVSEALFPFVPMRRVSSVARAQLLVEAPGAEPGRTHVVRFFPGGHDHDERGPCGCDRIDVECVAGHEHRGLFHGEVDLTEHGPLGPLRGSAPQRLGCFEFPDGLGEICNAYLVLGYCADRPRGCGGECGGKCGCGGIGGCRCHGCR